jgi:hypothetical protein
LRGPLFLLLRPRAALTQSFLHRVLHQHRNVLGDSRALVPAGLAEHRVMNLDLIGAVRKFSRQLVCYPTQLLLEYLTTRFLIDCLTHRHATRSSGSPAAPARSDRCLPYRLWGESLPGIHLNFTGAPD